MSTLRQRRAATLCGGVTRIVAGGQTGADRAALDWAIAHRLPHCGWCPAGRRAEDGVIDKRYALTELSSRDYLQRTRRNVEDSDGTLILNLGELDGGTRATLQFAKRMKRPVLVIQAEPEPPDETVIDAARWLHEFEIRTLNIAGPRESKRMGTYAAVGAFLDRLAATV